MTSSFGTVTYVQEPTLFFDFAKGQAVLVQHQADHDHQAAEIETEPDIVTSTGLTPAPA